MGNNQQLRMGSVRTTSRVGEKLAEMGEKWVKNGTKYPFVAVPCRPFFRRPKTFPSVRVVKYGTQVAGGKMGKKQGIRRYPPNRVPPRLAHLEGTASQGCDMPRLTKFFVAQCSEA